MLRQKLSLTLVVALIVVACASPQREEEKDKDAQNGPPEPVALEDRAYPAAKADAMHRKAEAKQASTMAREMAEGGASGYVLVPQPTSAPAPAEMAPPSPASADVLGAARYAPMVQDTEKYAHLDQSAV